MKHVLLVLCTFPGVLANAQQYQYVPFPTNNAVWRQMHVLPEQWSAGYWVNYYQHMVNGEDTVINGISYKKIIQRHYGTFIKSYPLPTGTLASSEPDKCIGGLREHDKRIYLNQTGTEELIYDFNLGVGDTLPKTFKSGPTIVKSIQQIQIGGVLRNAYVYDINGAGAPVAIIEGIGAPNRMPFESWAVMTCYYDDQNKIGYPDNCEKNVQFTLTPGWPTVLNDISTEKPFVTPNPFSEVLHITNTEATTATLYDLTGRVSLKTRIEPKTSILTDHLPNGIYLLTLHDKKGSLIETRKLLKK